MKYLKIPLLLIFVIILKSCSGNDSKSSIEISGTLEAVSVVVSSQSQGTIIQTFAEEGDRVKKGDLIYIIDTSAIYFELQRAEAMYVGANAAYGLLLSGARNEDLAVASEVIIQAKANYELAKSDFQRIENLFASSSVTQKQFDDAKTRFSVAESQLKSAEENLQKVKNIVRPQELQLAQAKLNEAKANIDIIKNRLSKCYVYAPVSGTILKKYSKEGESVNFLSNLFKITDLEQMELTVYINETSLGKILYGQKVDILTDTFTDKKYQGEVIYISPEASFTPKNIQTKDERTKLVFAVKIKVTNSNNELKSGMPADAVINF